MAALLLVGWAATVFVHLPGLLGALVVALAGTVPLVSVAAVPVATAAARRRRWESLVAAVVAGLVPWAFVLGYAKGDAPAQRDGTELTVLVVNARDGRARPAAVVAAVRAHDVDVLVVTELSRTLSHELAAAQLAQYVVPRWFRVADDPGAGLGVWSRQDVGATVPVPGTSSPAVKMQVQTRTGALTLVAGHAANPLPRSVDTWQADLEALDAAARQAPHTLLVGTLNASPWHVTYRRLLGSGLVDAADAQGTGLRPTWPTWSPVPLVPLDSAVVSADLTVLGADTVPVEGSDHRALLVTVEVPADDSARN